MASTFPSVHPRHAHSNMASTHDFPSVNLRHAHSNMAFSQDLARIHLCHAPSNMASTHQLLQYSKFLLLLVHNNGLESFTHVTSPCCIVPLSHSRATGVSITSPRALNKLTSSITSPHVSCYSLPHNMYSACSIVSSLYSVTLGQYVLVLLMRDYVTSGNSSPHYRPE